MPVVVVTTSNVTTLGLKITIRLETNLPHLNKVGDLRKTTYERVGV